MTGSKVQLFDGSDDLELAIDMLAERLPEALRPLAKLAYNYRWSWFPDGDALFHDIDPDRWRHSECNPRDLIETTPPRRLNQLAGDRDYVARVHSAAECLAGDLVRPHVPATTAIGGPVAYFSAEFAVHCSLPIYSGGLGVLAGDTLKAASDLAFPMVGVGLLYRQGYFHQRLDASGWQHEYWVSTEFERQPAVLVTGPGDEPLCVEVTLRQRPVRVQIWRVDVGRVPLYLLDTDHEDNDPIDRWITSRLYVGDRQIRLAQYAVLGIAGVRALEAMGIRPSVVHLNEGHAALSSLARAQSLARENGVPFEAALAAVREATVFTTHTPVAAGNEGYSGDEMEAVIKDFADSLDVAREALYGLGRINPENLGEQVNITPLALRTSRAANGVSRRHGEVARGMWQPLWPQRQVAEVPITHVTNGVHASTWMAREMQRLLDRYLRRDWRAHLADEAMWKDVDAIPDEELWAVRCKLREELVEFARVRSIGDRIGRGESAHYVGAAANVFSPETLTLGFARRVAVYKRMYLVNRLPGGGLFRLFADGPTPIQLVAAGKAHPRDDEAKGTLRDGFRLKEVPEIGRRVAFLEDYDLRIAPRIIAGVDLWINLPRPPLEASGTSGMKVVLNGGLNLSVMDGWWIEAYDGNNGWSIHTPNADANVQDDHDAAALLDLLEHEVIPLFYRRDAQGIPRGWVKRMKASMRSLIPRFNTERMLRDYIDRMYRFGPG